MFLFIVLSTLKRIILREFDRKIDRLIYNLM